MNKKISKILKVASAIGAGALLVAGGAVTTGVMKNDVIAEQVAQISQLQLDAEGLNTKIVDLENAEPVTVEIEKIVNQTVEVSVDNENLELVLDHVYDNDGSVEYLLDDLDEDQVAQIVDRVVFINEIKSLAGQEVDKEIADLLDKEEYVFGIETITFDEDDVERVRVQDDSDELKVVDVDFEDKDADVEVEVYFEQDDIKYKALCTVEFKDGEVDDVELDSVEER